MSIRARVTLFGIAVVAVIYTVVAVLIYVLLSYGFATDQDRLLAERTTAAFRGDGRPAGGRARSAPGAAGPGRRGGDR